MIRIYVFQDVNYSWSLPTKELLSDRLVAQFEDTLIPNQLHMSKSLIILLTAVNPSQRKMNTFIAS